MGKRVVPSCIMVGPEFITEAGHVTIRQWFQEPDAKLAAHEAARQMLWQEFGIDPLDQGIYAQPSTYTAAHVIGGAELVLPEDDMPMARGYPLAEASDVRRLRMPESYLEHPAMAPYVAMYDWLRERVGDRMAVGLGDGTQGPVTTAKLLRGQDFFADLVECPDEAHRLLEFVTEGTIRIWREVWQYQGQPLEGQDVHLGDDFAGLMGPAHFAEFAVPCYQRIYEAFKPARRLFHSELLRPGHLHCLADMHIDYLNLGENQYMTPSVVRTHTNVPFEWHVKTATVATGTPETVRAEFTAVLNDGAPGIVTELCARRIPSENIRAFVEIARRHGPIIEPGGCYRAAMKAAELQRSEEREE